MSRHVPIVLRRAGATLTALLALAASSYACSSEPAGGELDAGTSPTSTAPLPSPEAGASDGDAPRDATAPDASPPRPPPVFLAPNDYEDVATLDPAFPFGVVGRYAATGEVLGARWGNHGGPMVTTQVYTAQDAASAPGVIRYALPQAAQGTATATSVPFVRAAALPSTLFYGPDGMVDLPNGNEALLTYTGSGAGFPGEALVYTKDYTSLVARARTNGIYSAIGVPSGAIVFSALSPFSATASATQDNGLYVAARCGAELVATGACKPPAKLFGWSGSSGPVAVDALGNAFVAASESGGDTLYGASASEISAIGAAARVTLGAAGTTGTSSIAAVAPEGGWAGYVVGKGYDGARAEPAYAQGYGVASLRAEGTRISRAIVAGPKTEAFSVFASPAGDVWIAAELTEGAPRRVFLALRRRP